MATIGVRVRFRDTLVCGFNWHPYSYSEQWSQGTLTSVCGYRWCPYSHTCYFSLRCIATSPVLALGAMIDDGVFLFPFVCCCHNGCNVLCICGVDSSAKVFVPERQGKRVPSTVQFLHRYECTVDIEQPT